MPYPGFGFVLRGNVRTKHWTYSDRVNRRSHIGCPTYGTESAILDIESGRRPSGCLMTDDGRRAPRLQMEVTRQVWCPHKLYPSPYGGFCASCISYSLRCQTEASVIE